MADAPDSVRAAGQGAGPASSRPGLAAVLVRRRRLVLALTLVALVVAALGGAGVAERLSAGGFEDPSADSSRAARELERLGAGTPNLVLLVRGDGAVDDPRTAASGRRLTDELAAEPGVVGVRSYWAGGDPRLRSEDGTSAVVLARLTGDEDQVADRIEQLAPYYAEDRYGLEVRVGGRAATDREIVAVSERDLTRAELIAGPVTLVILVLVFGSVVAATLPLAIGLFAVVGTYFALRLLVGVTDVSVFALNITTALGLGLAIDYSLFIVTRFREELAAGRDVEAAIVATMGTAGRTVIFSALTVTLSLSALLVFPLYFLRSLAYAGAVVVVLAATGAVVVLPALLAVLGRRVDRLDVRRPLRALRPAGRHTAGRRRAPRQDGGFWHALALFVMRRPVPLAASVILLLLLLGSPFTRASFAFFDDRVLPASSEVHRVAQTLRDDFPSLETGALTVVLTGHGVTQQETGAVADYAQRLSQVPGVLGVEAPTGSYAEGQQVSPAGPASAGTRSQSGAWLAVLTAVEPYSAAGTELARAVRDVRPPDTAHEAVLVGGPGARLLDNERALGARLPLAAGIIALTTLVLLFLFTGSVLIPLKAIVVNVLSLTATFGAMVWVFQEGRLQWLVGDFIVTGTLDMTMPVLMFCVAFGLSMDYEVFLLSRIKEQYELTRDNVSAVARGLEQTGRLVSAAAVLIAVVFLALATSSLTFLKLLGVGLALAVIVDATLVRGVLVPAFMRLAGQANWWAPGPLRRLHERFGLSESGPAVPSAPVVGTTVTAPP